MRLIEPKVNDTRVTSRRYLSWWVSHAKYWTGAKSGKAEYRPVNAKQMPLGEYQPPNDVCLNWLPDTRCGCDYCLGLA